MENKLNIILIGVLVLGLLLWAVEMTYPINALIVLGVLGLIVGIEIWIIVRRG
jgi:hypothetical protein